MTRPRIADDFVVIRARIEEMRRERAQVSAEQDGRSVTGTKPHNVKGNSLSKLEGHYCALIRRTPPEIYQTWGVPVRLNGGAATHG
jgi:hypothetical protein